MPKNIKSEYKCPLEATMDIIGGKYKGVIIGHLIGRTLRYNELQKLISHATPKMLIQQLKELETHGMIRKIVHPGVPLCVEYAITNDGRSLLPIINSLREWGESFRPKMEAILEKEKKHPSMPATIP